MNLITESPLWLTPFCLIAGIIYAAILYFREKTSEFTLRMKWIMASIRFIAVSIIAFLLLSPLVKTMIRTVEKPVIILAQDNSNSLLINRDSAFYKSKYKEQINKLYEDLATDFDVRTYSFSDKVVSGLNTDFTGKQTDISELINELLIRYANRNAGALIIASDGIYNKGNNPLYTASGINFPIYTIALGDTNTQKDIILNQVNYNKVCYLGNSFPVEAIVAANKCQNTRTNMTVSYNGQVLFSKTININDPAYIETVSLTLDAHQSGIQHYRVMLSAVEGEISTQNNMQDIYVDVLDARQKILILAGAPHPDVAALKESIEKNQNYEVEVFMRNEYNKNFEGYNLLILHQIPYLGEAMSPLISSLTDSKIPVLFILGNSSDVMQFNKLKTGLNITQSQNRTDETQAVINNSFALFNLNDDARKIAGEAPPLVCPFGVYKYANSSISLFYQRIGKVATEKPLIIFNQASEIKTGVVCGEGLWRWRLYDWLKTGNHKGFDELTSKIIQYLCVKADKSFFRVNCKNRFLENEQVIFDAEVYNESYEMINDPEVKITITDVSGKKFNFAFTKTAAAYHLNAGLFPVGDYRYSAQVKVGNNVMQENGEFTVSVIAAESLNLVADHILLNALASRHGGEMIFPSQIDELTEKIKSRDDIKSVSYTQNKFSDIINLFWVFILIVTLLSAEWFLRKRSGAY